MRDLLLFEKDLSSQKLIKPILKEISPFLRLISKELLEIEKMEEIEKFQKQMKKIVQKYSDCDNSDNSDDDNSDDNSDDDNSDDDNSDDDVRDFNDIYNPNNNYGKNNNNTNNIIYEKPIKKN